MTHDLKEFDMTKIIANPHCNIIVVGKKHTGKSTIIKHILDQLKETLPIVIVMCGSEGLNGSYGKMIPDMFIFDSVRSDKFGTIRDRHESFIKLVDSKVKNFEGLNKNICLILDDCLENIDWTRDNNMTHFITNGRHMKLTIIIAVQALKKLPPTIRNNIDYAFVLRNNNYSEQKNIREELMGLFKEKREFEQTLKKYTDDYKCIVVDNMSQSNEIKDVYSWFKADLNKSPKMCLPIYWEINTLLKKYFFQKIKMREKLKNN